MLNQNWKLQSLNHLMEVLKPKPHDMLARPLGFLLFILGKRGGTTNAYNKFYLSKESMHGSAKCCVPWTPEGYLYVIYSSSILVRPLLQLLTTTTISWNKTKKIGVKILEVYIHIYIVLLIVYPQFGKQSLLAPLIMSGVVRVSV